MRKLYRVLMLAALAAALVVPVGYALSVESTPVAAHIRHTVVAPAVTMPSAAANVVTAPITIPVAPTALGSVFSQLSDAVKLFGVGTVLFGLAAALRKAG